MTSEEKRTKLGLADRYAHRGFHDETAPENSLAAFRKAVQMGFHTELDVHMIADATLVVFHDDDLERMTGVSGRIADYDLVALRSLRLAGTEEYIPTFDEVLDSFEDSGLSLLIELKVDRGNYRALSRAVANRLQNYCGDFAVQSFDPRVLMEFRKLMPDVARGQLSKNFFAKRSGLSIAGAAVMTDMRLNALAKPDFISYKFKDRDNKALRREVDGKGKAEAAWTIRTPNAYRMAVEAGCIPIFEGFNPDELKGGLR